MALVIEELIAKLGIQVDKAKIDGAIKSIDSVKKSFIGIKTAALAATTAAFFFEKSLTKGVADIGKNAQAINLPTDQFQALEFAAKKAGVSTDTLFGAIGGIENQLAKAHLGEVPTQLAEGLAKISHITGKAINFTDANGKIKPTIQLVKEVAQAMESVSDPQKRLAISMSIFGADLREVLTGWGKINQAQDFLKNRKLMITDEEIENAKKFNEQLVIMEQSFKKIGQKLATALTPWLKQVNDFILDILDPNRNTFQEFLGYIKKDTNNFSFFPGFDAFIQERVDKIGALFSGKYREPEVRNPKNFYLESQNYLPYGGMQPSVINTNNQASNESNQSTNNNSNVVNNTNNNSVINQYTNPSLLGNSYFYAGTR